MWILKNTYRWCLRIPFFLQYFSCHNFSITFELWVFLFVLFLLVLLFYRFRYWLRFWLWLLKDLKKVWTINYAFTKMGNAHNPAELLTLLLFFLWWWRWRRLGLHEKLWWYGLARAPAISFEFLLISRSRLYCQ